MQTEHVCYHKNHRQLLYPSNFFPSDMYFHQNKNLAEKYGRWMLNLEKEVFTKLFTVSGKISYTLSNFTWLLKLGWMTE